MELLPYKYQTEEEARNWKVKDVNITKVYYLGYNRNAWHSTWIERYWRYGSFHTSLRGAKAAAEDRRVQGSKFIILEVPVITIISSKGALIYITFRKDFLEVSPKNLIGTFYNNVSLKVYYELSRRRPLTFESFTKILPVYNQDDFYLFKGENDELEPYSKSHESAKYVSESIGSNYYLQWSCHINDFKYDLNVAIKLRDTLRLLMKKSSNAMYHYIMNFNTVTPQVLKSKKYMRLSKFLKNRNYPNGREIWVNNFINSTTEFELCENSLNELGYKIVVKDSLTYQFSKPEWWPSDTIRISFPAIFYIMNSIDDVIIPELRNVLYKLLELCYDQGIENSPRRIVFTFNNASLKIVHFEIDFNKNVFGLKKSKKELLNRTIQHIQELLGKIHKGIVAWPDQIGYYDNIRFRITKYEAKTLNFIKV